MLDAVEWLVEHEGAEVTWLPVDAAGTVSVDALREVLATHDDVALVTVMWANNEVGTIAPIAELAAVAAEFDVPMHSDAIQAVGAGNGGFRRQRTVCGQHRGAQIRWSHGDGRAAVAS